MCGGHGAPCFRFRFARKKRSTRFHQEYFVETWKWQNAKNNSKKWFQLPFPDDSNLSTCLSVAALKRVIRDNFNRAWDWRINMLFFMEPMAGVWQSMPSLFLLPLGSHCFWSFFLKKKSLWPRWLPHAKPGVPGNICAWPQPRFPHQNPGRQLPKWQGKRKLVSKNLNNSWQKIGWHIISQLHFCTCHHVQ